MIKIAELPPGALPALLDLYRDLHEEDALPSHDLAQQTWKEIQSNPRIKYFGAYDGEILLSTCTLTIIPNLTRACRPYGLIENVVTRKDQRHQGLGKNILKHTLDYARQQNCYKVMLMTGRLDQATFRFYESVGFERQSKQAFMIKLEQG